MSSADTKAFHTYTLIDSATLTASLNDNVRIYPAYGLSILDLEIYYTLHALASSRTCTVFVEYSSDGTTFVPYTAVHTDIAHGHDMLIENPVTIAGTTGGTAYNRKLRIPDLLPYVRVSAKEDGSSNFGTIKILGTFS